MRAGSIQVTPTATRGAPVFNGPRRFCNCCGPRIALRRRSAVWSLTQSQQTRSAPGIFASRSAADLAIAEIEKGTSFGTGFTSSSPSSGLKVDVQTQRRLWSQYLPPGSFFEESADVVLVVEGWMLIAHRTQLALTSNVFRELFDKADQSTTDVYGNVIVLRRAFEERRLMDVLLLLRYVYSMPKSNFMQELTDLGRDALVLADMAHELDMPDLLAACDAALCKYLEAGGKLALDGSESEDLVDITVRAHQWQLEQLMLWCEAALIKDFSRYQLNPRLAQLPASSWERLAKGLYHVLSEMQQKGLLKTEGGRLREDVFPTPQDLRRWRRWQEEQR